MSPLCHPFSVSHPWFSKFCLCPWSFCYVHVHQSSPSGHTLSAMCSVEPSQASWMHPFLFLAFACPIVLVLSFPTNYSMLFFFCIRSSKWYFKCSVGPSRESFLKITAWYIFKTFLNDPFSGWGDGSVGKELAEEAWGSEFGCLDPRKDQVTPPCT